MLDVVSTKIIAQMKLKQSHEKISTLSHCDLTNNQYDNLNKYTTEKDHDCVDTLH